MSNSEQEKQVSDVQQPVASAAQASHGAEGARDEKPPSKMSAWRSTLAASRLLQVLGVVLIAQLVLAGGLYWGAGRDSSFVAAEQMVTFDDTKADRLQIETPDGQLVIARAGDIWQLQGDHALPADPTRVDQLLAQLGNLKASLPVATTTAARDQLEVAEDNFQRHITVQQGDQTLVDLYVGTSPGYQRSHVRRADDNAIVAARLNVYDVPDDVDGWMDRTLLSFNEVSRVKTDDFTLTRVDEKWTIEAPEALVADHQVATEPMEKLLGALQGLRVTGLVLEDEKPDAASAESMSSADSADEADEPEIIGWEITDKSGDPLTLTLSRQGDEVRVQRSDWPLEFKAPLSVFDTLNGMDVAILLPEKSAGEEAVSGVTSDEKGSDTDAMAAPDTMVE